MARFFFVAPPIPSHAAPLIAMAKELARRGHDCAVAGHSFALGRLFGDDVRLLVPLAEEPARQIVGLLPALVLRTVGGRFLIWRDVFHPLGECMRDEVMTAVRDFRPDVIAADQITVAGFHAAREMGVPFAVVAGSMLPVSLGETWGEGGKDSGQPSLSKQFMKLGAKAELVASLRLIIETAPARTLVLSLGEFVPSFRPPAHVQFTGPILAPRTARAALSDSAGMPLIYVGLGNIVPTAASNFYSAVALALGDKPVRVIVSAPDGMIANPPANFQVRPHWPQRDILARADAVICHGGFNTVCEALAEGLPLVCAPAGGDTPMITRQMEQAGAAIRVSLRRPSAAEIGAAVDRVLRESSFREAAGRFSLLLRQADALGVAVRSLEGLTTNS